MATSLLEELVVSMNLNYSTTGAAQAIATNKKVSESLNEVEKSGKGTAEQTQQVADAQNENKKATEDNSRAQGRLLGGYLSVMFAGMALSRAMSGLLSTSLEWTGVTELLSLTLGVVFLPVAEQLLGILLPILNWFMEWPDWAKTFLGWIVLIAAGIGFLLTLVGQIGLAMIGFEALSSFGGVLGGLTEIGNKAEGVEGKVSGLSKTLGDVGVSLAVTLAVTTFVTGLTEDSLVDALDDFVISGLAVAIASALLGAATVPAVSVGALTLLVGLGIKWLLDDPSNISQVIKDSIDGFARGGISGAITGAISSTGRGVLGDLYAGAKDKIFSGSTLPSTLPQSSLSNPTEPIFNNSNASNSPNINITQNISGSTSPEIKALIEQNNQTITNQMRSLFKT